MEIIKYTLVAGFQSDYAIRSLLLIVGGIGVMILAYYIAKKSHKFRMRTFSEIIDKILSSGWSSQLITLFALSIIAFLFSWALIDSINELYWNGIDSPLGEHQSFWLTICYFFDAGNLNITNHLDPGIQGVISLIVAILGMTLLTGLFISTFTNIIEQRVNSVNSGTITYKGIRSHFVIIGFCEITESVIRGIFEKYGKNSKVILITKENIHTVRESLYDIVTSKQYDGQLVLYSGDYRVQENLNRLNLSTSKSIFILGEKSIRIPDYDNFACYQQIEDSLLELKNRDNTPIPIYVRMDDIKAFSTLQRLDISSKSTNTYFRPFNTYELWSRYIWNGGEIEVCDSFNQKKKIAYPSFNYYIDKEQLKYTHLVICGFNQMAQALILQSIRSAHFSNYTEENNCVTKITVIETHLNELWLGFSTHFRNLEQVYDIKIELRNCSLKEMEQELVDWSCDESQRLIIAICSDNQDSALEQGLNLPDEVYYQHGKKSTNLPFVFIEQKVFLSVWEHIKKAEQTELYDKIDNPILFRKTKYDKYHNVYPFGMKIRSIYPNNIDDLKACIIHSDYESQWGHTDKKEEELTIHHLYELIENKENEKLKVLLDKAFIKWYTLPENLKSANRYQTDNHKQFKMILAKNGILSMKQISKLNEKIIFLCSDIEHRRWIGERVVAGWHLSPYEYNGVVLRQDSLRMHQNIRKTSQIQDEIDKDANVIVNVLMLDEICEYIKNNQFFYYNNEKIYTENDG